MPPVEAPTPWRVCSLNGSAPHRGKPFYVENVAGASGILAAEQVAQARPDGYTLFMAATPQIAIAPTMFKVKYDPVKDFVPISAVITNTFALVVNQKVPAKTVSEFVDYIRSQATQLPYSTSGIGSVTHLAMESFLNRTKLKMTNVNYKGSAPAMAAVIAGEVPAMFSVSSESLPHAAGQAIRLLAVSSEERIPRAPDVPTFIELGFSGFIVKSWNGLMAPEGTPQTIVDQLANEVALAMKDQEFVARLKAFGAEPLGNTPDEFENHDFKGYCIMGRSIEGCTRQHSISAMAK